VEKPDLNDLNETNYRISLMYQADIHQVFLRLIDIWVVMNSLTFILDRTRVVVVVKKFKHARLGRLMLGFFVHFLVS